MFLIQKGKPDRPICREHQIAFSGRKCPKCVARNQHLKRLIAEAKRIRSRAV